MKIICFIVIKGLISYQLFSIVLLTTIKREKCELETDNRLLTVLL